MSNRHLARTIAMQSLFNWDFNGRKNEDLDQIIKSNFANFAPDFDDRGFVESLIWDIVNNIEEIDKYIVKYATDWPLNQITLVDRNTLRIGIYELLKTADIPPKVAINEAIEIAKTFGGGASGKFVNGVLGAIYQKNKKEIDAGKNPDKEQLQKREKQYSAGAIVMRAEDEKMKIVLITDSYNRRTFPKSRLLPEEKNQNAVRRAVKEGLGIDEIEIGEKVGEFEVLVRDPRSSQGPKLISLYLVKCEQKELNPIDEKVKQAEWFGLEEVEDKLGYDQVREIWRGVKEKINK